MYRGFIIVILSSFVIAGLFSEVEDTCHDLHVKYHRLQVLSRKELDVVFDELLTKQCNISDIVKECPDYFSHKNGPRFLPEPNRTVIMTVFVGTALAIVIFGLYAIFEWIKSILVP